MYCLFTESMTEETALGAIPKSGKFLSSRITVNVLKF